MGLDFVEIIMELEDTFEIEIEDDDWAGLVQQHDLMVADLYRVVQDRIRNRLIDGSDVRLNLDLWHDMRSLLNNVTAVPEEQIRLNTRLRDLFPRSLRSDRWEKLQAASRLQVAPLEHAKLLRQLLGWMVLAGGIVTAIVTLVWLPIPGWMWFWLGCASPLLLVLSIWPMTCVYEWMLRLCSPFKLSLPDRLNTVKDLCRSVRTGYSTVRNGVRVEPSERQYEKSWSQFVSIISEQLAVPLDEIKPESRLVKDLKMD